MMSVQGELGREEVAKALEHVLARREFRHERSLLEDFLDWLSGRFDLGEGASVLGEVLFWVLIGTLAGLTVYFAFKFLAAGRSQRRRARQEAARSVETAVERALRLRREARAAFARGDLKLALRMELFALVVGLGGRGDLEYRDAWTNRELLFRGNPSPGSRAFLVPLVEELEPKEFGRDEVTPDDVERLERLCEHHLGPLEERAA